MRRLLITGGTGQLGIELLRQPWPADVQLHAPLRTELDLSSADSIRAMLGRARWDGVINLAAYVAVDAAEEEAGNAFQANSQGPAWLAETTAKADIPLVHISTDYVFSGDSDQPYVEDDPVCPRGVYGASKAAGELAVRSANPRSVVVRTAWVLSPHRSNFLKTMLRIAARQPSVRVVADQRGCPTSAADIAAALMTIALRHTEDPGAPVGTYHFVNSGEASWHELAIEIFPLSAGMGGPSAQVVAIATDDFPTRARRPANSRLATGKIRRDFGIRPRDWREAVADILADLHKTNELKEIAR